MLREILTRLAESSSDQSDELQNYVLEIMLTLESAINSSDTDVLFPHHLRGEHPRQASDVTLSTSSTVVPCDMALSQRSDVHSSSPIVSGKPPVPTTSSSKAPPSSSTSKASVNNIKTPVASTKSVPSTTTSSAKAPIILSKPPSTSSVQATPTHATPTTTQDDTPTTASLPVALMSQHRRGRHSRGHSISKIEIPSDEKESEETPADSTSSESPPKKQDDEEKGPPYSPTGAGAVPLRPQSAVYHIKNSVSVDHRLHSESATNIHAPPIQRVASSTREETSTRQSAPPIHLMNLFEPLPSAASKPININTSGRPMSEVFMSRYPDSSLTTSFAAAPFSSLSITTSTPTAVFSPPQGDAAVPAKVAPPESSLSTSLKMSLDTSSSLNMSLQNEPPKTSPTDTAKPSAPPASDNASTKTTPTQSDSTPTVTLTKTKSPPLSKTYSLPEQHLNENDEEDIGDMDHKEDMEEDEEKRLPHQDSLELPSANTSFSSNDSTNIVRIPSHPDLRMSSFHQKASRVDSSPIIRARSVSTLLREEGEEEKPLKIRSYSGSRDSVPGYQLMREGMGPVRGSLERLREKASSAAPTSSSHTKLPLSHQNSPSKPIEREAIKRRTSADPERERVHSAAGLRGKSRPKSMFETGSFHVHPQGSLDLAIASSDFLAQLFWVSVSLLESDYEGEFTMALRLFDRVTSQLDFCSEITYTRLEGILNKMKWDSFPGVLKLLLKGLTLNRTTHTTRKLLSSLCSHMNRYVFDTTGSLGLPLCIMALLPELVFHFEEPTDDSKQMAESISKVRSKAIFVHCVYSSSSLLSLSLSFSLSSLSPSLSPLSLPPSLPPSLPLLPP